MVVNEHFSAEEFLRIMMHNKGLETLLDASESILEWYSVSQFGLRLSIHLAFIFWRITL